MDDSALVATAKRCVLRDTGIDLSACRRWTKFMEIEYRSSSAAPASDAASGAGAPG